MKLSFVIPAYNEEGDLSFVLEEVLKLGAEKGWDYEIIVVNGNSSDATGEIADSYAEKYGNVLTIHRRNGHRGMGLALKEGAKKARGDIII